MLRDLSGKTALVTGAASGIGRGLAEALAAEGMRVFAADIDAEGLADLSATLERAGRPHLTGVLDIRDRAAWAETVDRAEAALGPVQLLCNNAGVTATPQPMLDQPPEAWDWVVGVNLTGPFNGAREVGRRLRAKGLPGHIVNTASVQGLFAAKGFAPYNAAKFGVVGLSETLRLELEPHDVGVSVLCPGPVKTNIMPNSVKLAPQFAASQAPTARPVGFTIYQTPAEVAAKVIEAVRANRFYIITHAEYRLVLEARAAALASSLGVASAEGLSNVAEVEADILKGYEAMAGAHPS